MMIMEITSHPSPNSLGGEVALSVARSAAPVRAADKAVEPEREGDERKPADVEPTVPEIERAVVQLRQTLLFLQRELNVSVDAASGRIIVSLVDTATGEVLRRIPVREVVRIAESIGDSEQGVFIRQEA